MPWQFLSDYDRQALTDALAGHSQITLGATERVVLLNQAGLSSITADLGALANSAARTFSGELILVLEDGGWQTEPPRQMLAALLDYLASVPDTPVSTRELFAKITATYELYKAGGRWRIDGRHIEHKPELLTLNQVVELVIELKNTDQPVVWDGRVPYVGLRAFQEEDAKFFFGRDALIKDLLVRVEQGLRFIIIAGPSGSGKSSVARAGLFHALRAGRIDGSDNWVLATMSPRDNPIANLGLAFGRDLGNRQAEAALLQDAATNPATLHDQVERLAAMSDDRHRRLVLLVDQFEELFTQTADTEIREAFIRMLATAAETDGGRVIVVIALRSDFVSNCALYPELRDQINKDNQFVLVGAMEPRELATAVTRPALEVGTAIDPALVKQIVDDMKGEPGALPLMSFALLDLFKAERPPEGPGHAMDMTLQEYLKRGGLSQALERHADGVFATLSAEQQVLARGIFSRLVEIGQGRLDTRRTVAFDDLVPTGADRELVARTVAELAEQKARLITTGGTGEGIGPEGIMAATVTIAHEKLIDAWPWLRQLIDENREAIKLQNVIEENANLWSINGRDPSFLYLGNRLSSIQDQLKNIELPLQPLSQAFIEASVVQSRLIEEEKVRAEENERKRLLEIAQVNRQKFETERRLRNQTRTGLIAVSLIALILFILLTAPFMIKQIVKYGRYSDTVEIDRTGLGIDAYEVTLDRYAKCLAAGGCRNAPSNFDSVYPGNLKAIYLSWLPNLKNEQWNQVRYLPVVEVNAFDAARFCNWIDRRLPTLNEWIIAASHKSNKTWPPSEDSPSTTWANVNSSELSNGSLLPVGSRKSGQGEYLVEGGLEIYDLIGNVWEWTVTDRDGNDHLVNLNDAENLMLVGGSFETSVSYLVEHRNSFGSSAAIPQYRDGESGFRCVRNSK